MKHFIYILLLSILFSCGGNKTYIVDKSKITQNNMENNVFKFTLNAIDGTSLPLANFKGKKLLIVNVASKCGFTKQYTDLQTLSEKYKDKLVILGIPSNDFMGQEPGTETEIQTFCQKNYGVTFPLTAKVIVSGTNAVPLYKWLCSKEENGLLNAEVTWNFNKFLIDENGQLVAKFDSGVKPLDDEIIGFL